jgi:thiamine biosynthesis lipoprotein
MSRFLADSDVSRLSAAKAGTAVRVDPDTFAVLQGARDVYVRSGGAYDVTVGPLVGLYRRCFRQLGRPPTEPELVAARALVGADGLLLDERHMTAALRTEGMVVDLSSVAKGFAADRALAALRRSGARAALVEIGGEVAVYGRKPDGSRWSVGLQHPRSPGKFMAALELDRGAVATSGDYAKPLRAGRRPTTHNHDPRTGKPQVGGAVSVTVLAPTCVLADALATAISVLGPEEGLKLIESYRREGLRVEALIMEEAGDGGLVPHVSPGLRELELAL